jgi:hypothetical protein
MRGVARKLKLGAAAIHSLNLEPQKIDAEVQRCRYVLQTAADEFCRHVMGFQENKAAVAATRQENDAATKVARKGKAHRHDIKCESFFSRPNRQDRKYRIPAPHAHGPYF